jgi:hypothetical protein
MKDKKDNVLREKKVNEKDLNLRDKNLNHQFMALKVNDYIVLNLKKIKVLVISYCSDYNR